LNKRIRPIIYVCSAIHNNNLLSKMIEAPSLKEASNFFTNQFGIEPKEILGPFYK